MDLGIQYRVVYSFMIYSRSNRHCYQAGAAVAAAAYIDGRLQITKDLRDLWNVKRAQFEWNRAGNLPTKSSLLNRSSDRHQL
jgi:hypothetical protein